MSSLRTLCIVLLAASPFVTGCGLVADEEGDVDTTSQELVARTKINVGNGTAAYDRWKESETATNDHRLYMTETATNPIPSYTYKKTMSYCTIAPWDPTCSSKPPFTWVDDDYKGCGRRAAQNALAYFGVKMSQGDIGDDVAGIDIPFSSLIATFPDQLRDGLQEILDRKVGGIAVSRRSHATKTDIRSALSRGYPVVALVQNGSHWVVIGGSKSSGGSYWVIDGASAYWMASSSISLEFSGTPAWASFADFFTSYEEGTIITFGPKVSGGGGGSPGGITYQKQQR